MAGGRPPLGERALTKRERDQRSRAKQLKRLADMTDAMAAIADPMLIRTLREARMRAQAVLDEQSGSGTPSAAER
jgi:type IV secretory pathway ATPase VirB11/archaellum biosynthesis ATPase